MLFLMSGRDGSIGYSFFSEFAGISLNFDITGEQEPFSGEDDIVGDQDPVNPSDPLFIRSPSMEARTPDNFGGTTMTSTGRCPLASSRFGSAPTDRSNLTASMAAGEPPEAAQWRAVNLSGPQAKLTSTFGCEIINLRTLMLPYVEATINGVRCSRTICFEPFLRTYHIPTSSIADGSFSIDRLKPS